MDIKRIVGVGRAAVNRAWKNGELASVPHFREVRVGEVPPKGRPLDIDEVATLFNAMHASHLRLFCLLMLGTASRPDVLCKVLQCAPEGYLVQFRGRPVKQIMTSWRNTRLLAGLDAAVQPYSLRHTMARWLRKSGVSAWEVVAQLGHKQREFSTTEMYAPFDPSYLTTSKTAIDAFMVEVV